MFQMAIRTALIASAMIVLAVVADDVRDERVRRVTWRAAKVAAWVLVGALIVAGITK